MGNINRQYDVSTLGIPPIDASTKCMLVQAGSGDNNVYLSHIETCWVLESYIHSLFYMKTDNMTDGDEFTALRLVEEEGSDPVAFVKIVKESGALEWRFFYFDSVLQQYGESSGAGYPLSIETWYRFEFKYDITNRSVGVQCYNASDDLLVNVSETITGNYLQPGKFHIGAADCSLSGDIEVAFDLAAWKQGDWYFTSAGISSDGISFADGSDNIQSASRSAAQGLGLSDAESAILFTTQSQGDSVVLSDLRSVLAIIKEATQDSVVLSEVLDNFQNSPQSSTDTLITSEAISGVGIAGASIADAVTVSEEIPDPRVFTLKIASDSLVVVDDLYPRVALSIPMTEVVGLSDSSTPLRRSSDTLDQSVSFLDLGRGISCVYKAAADQVLFDDDPSGTVKYIRSTSSSIIFSTEGSPRTSAYANRSDGILGSEAAAVRAAAQALRQDGVAFWFEWPTYWIIIGAVREDGLSVSDARNWARAIFRPARTDGIALSESTQHSNVVYRALMQQGLVLSDEVGRVALQLAAAADGIVLEDVAWIPLFLAEISDGLSFSDSPGVLKTAQALTSDGFSFSDIVSSVLTSLAVITQDSIQFTDAADGIKNLILGLSSDSVQFSDETGLFSLVFQAQVADNIVMTEAISSIISLTLRMQDWVGFTDRCIELYRLPVGKVGITVNLKQASLSVEFKQIGADVDIKQVGVTTTLK